MTNVALHVQKVAGETVEKVNALSKRKVGSVPRATAISKKQSIVALRKAQERHERRLRSAKHEVSRLGDFLRLVDYMASAQLSLEDTAKVTDVRAHMKWSYHRPNTENVPFDLVRCLMILRRQTCGTYNSPK